MFGAPARATRGVKTFSDCLFAGGAGEVYYWTFRVFVAEPLFKAYCRSYGRNVRTESSFIGCRAAAISSSAMTC